LKRLYLILFLWVASAAWGGTETMPPDAVLTATNLSNATLGDVDEPGACPSAGDGAQATSNNVATRLHCSFGTPALALTVGADLQVFRLLAAEFSATQTGVAKARIELWESGALVRAGPDVDLTDATCQQITLTWNASEVTAAANVEINIVGTQSGGGPTARNSANLLAVEWLAETSEPPTPTPTETHTPTPTPTCVREPWRYFRVLATTMEQGAPNEYDLAVLEFELRDATGTNLSLTSQAYVSSQFSVVYEATKAIDGNFESLWKSEIQSEATSEQWIYVDIGEVSSVNEITVNWADDGTSIPTGWKIQGATDPCAWFTIQTFTAYDPPDPYVEVIGDEICDSSVEATCTPTPTFTPTDTPTETNTPSETPTPTFTPDNQAPLVTLDVDPLEGPGPLTAELTGAATDPEGALAEYSWSFEDPLIIDATAAISGATVVSVTTHIYQPGIYTVTFRATDEFGLTGDATQEVIAWTPTPTFTATFTPTETFTPTATFTNVIPSATLECSNTEGNPPLEASLVGWATDTDGLLVLYSWAFGESGQIDATAEISSATIQIATTHSYVNPGIYTVVWAATDDRGGAADATCEIVVWTPIPTETFTPTPTETFTPTPTATNDVPDATVECVLFEGPAPLEASLVGWATDVDGLLIQYSWAFEDPDILDATADVSAATIVIEATHLYANPGIFGPVFCATDDSGDVACATCEVIVWTPTPTFTPTPTQTNTPSLTPTHTPEPTPTNTPEGWVAGWYYRAILQPEIYDD